MESFQPSQSFKIGVIDILDEMHIEFDVVIHSFPSGWANILHCTPEDDYPRVLAFWIHANSASGQGFYSQYANYENNYNYDLVDYGVTPGRTLYECEGDCDSDSECASDLVCFYNGAGQTNVPQGCQGSAKDNYDYCYDTTNFNQRNVGGSLILGRTYHLEMDITQSTFKIRINGRIVTYDAVAIHPLYKDVTCYASDPWYDAADVTISNLIIRGMLRCRLHEKRWRQLLFRDSPLTQIFARKKEKIPAPSLMVIH